MSTTAADTAGIALMGYRRADGRLGLRNHLLILSTLALTNRIAQLAAARTPGSLLVAGDMQRGLRGRDAQLQDRVLRSLISHPNVGGAVVFAHDTPSRVALQKWADSLGRPIQVIAFMEGLGVDQTIQRALAAVATVQSAMATDVRTAGHLGELTVALECGGSDPSSALCANPAIGGFVDRLVAAGGTAIVSETAEFIGAEPVVAQRAATAEASHAILAAIGRREAMMAADGEDYRGVNPTQENIAGGLTTLIEKSMGAVVKCGVSPLMGCLDFAEAPPGPGLWFMDTPFFSPVSLTGMVCGGAQLVLFGIGVFNPSAVPLAPTIKVCGNPATVRDWADAIDLDVSSIIQGSGSVEAAADALADTVRAVSAGDLTRAEHWGEGQIIVPREMASI